MGFRILAIEIEEFNYRKLSFLTFLYFPKNISFSEVAPEGISTFGGYTWSNLRLL